ncbi:MAG: hypothetical protein KatS3mg066_3376 [Fischerella sp.]|nr:MAG: hypothetical protein KatS3mg066_3376 [Fischerella sp.]
MQLCQVNLVTIIQTALETVYPSADDKSIRLESKLDDAVPPIVGDPHRLQQILGNVLSNAIKFTPEGGRVEVRLERVVNDTNIRDGDQGIGETRGSVDNKSMSNRFSTSNFYVQITVTDTGIGINPNFLPHIFERYRQVESYKEGGLGLGLAIARHLVELHGGTIEAKSEGEGKGATFTILLPFRG